MLATTKFRFRASVRQIARAVRRLARRTANKRPLPEQSRPSRRTSSHRTSLPPELWAEIFAFAAYDPGALDHNPPPYKRDEQIGTTEAATYNRLLRTKCAIIAVCRSWRNLSTSMLYEDVRFQYRISCLDISNVLQMLSRRTCGDRPVGWYTKRLDISWTFLEDNLVLSPADVSLFQFLETCPNLTHFCVDGWMHGMRPTWLGQLSHALNTKPLRFFQCVHYGMIDTNSLFIIPTLSSLVIPFCTQLPQNGSITLPNVLSVTFDLSASGQVTSLGFPNLQKLGLVNITRSHQRWDSPSDLLKAYIPFFSQYCHNLRSLRLGCPFLGIDSLPQKWRSLSRLLLLAPQLEELILDNEHYSGAIAWLKQDVTLTFPLLTTITLLFRKDTPIPGRRRPSFFSGPFPNVQRIQYLPCV